LLWCDETMQGALVDAGGDSAKLLAAVAKAKVKISKLILTHGHLDHVGAVEQLAKHFDVKLKGHIKKKSFG
jgi:hydroxyacylglutathione hydrolase